VTQSFPRELYATLSSFTPPRGLEGPIDWDEAVQRLAQHGLASLAAYNLEFKMRDARPPQGARELLMGYQQGASNDVVYKLVTLKGVLASIPSAPVVLLDSVAFVETLYPHVSFRGVPEVKLLVQEKDLPEIAAAMSEHRFLPVEPEEPDADGPRFTLWDQRIHLLLFTRFFPVEGHEAGVFARGASARALGRTALRPSPEDALLLQVASLARHGFRVPLIAWVDLRELVLGRGGPVSRGGPGAPLDPALVLQRAEEVGLTRALAASMALLGFFQPEVEGKLAPLTPSLPGLVRAGLDAALSGCREPFTAREARVTQALRQLVLGAAPR